MVNKSVVQRFKTSVVVVGVILFFLNTPYAWSMLFFTSLLGLALFEWLRLFWQKIEKKWLLISVFSLWILAGCFLLGWYEAPVFLASFQSYFVDFNGLFSTVFLFVFPIFLGTLVVFFARTAFLRHRNKRMTGVHVVWLFGCVALIVFNVWSFSILVTMQDILLRFIVLVWLADSGAWLCGYFYGKHRLLPSISPKKTWEGFVGGWLFCALGASWFFGIESGLWLSFIVFIAALFGDLWVSLFKRQLNRKDTGRLLPGHGGILDRVDALLIVLPVLVYGLNFSLFSSLIFPV